MGEENRRLKIQFTDQQGREIDLEDYLGRVVLVDFWATWCPPCLRDMPELLELWEEHHEAGLEIIGISLDRDEDKFTDFIADRKIPWPQQFDGKGWRNDIARLNQIKELPLTFLYDREGKLVGEDLRGEPLREAIESVL